MRVFLRRLLCATVMVGVGTPIQATAAPSRYGLENAEAASHADAAAQAAARKEYDTAINHLKAAYAIEPKPSLLYAWAQCERLAGNYRAAISLYEAFLEQNPDGDVANQARTNLIDARAKALEKRPEADPPKDETADEADPPPPPPETDTPGKSPVAGEWLAPTLLGVGAAVAVTGGVLMGIASGRVSDSANAPTEQGYFNELDGGRNLYYGGAATLGAGGLIIVGGVIRYVLVARKGRRSNTQTSAMVTPRGFGLTLSGRF